LGGHRLSGSAKRKCVVVAVVMAVTIAVAVVAVVVVVVAVVVVAAIVDSQKNGESRKIIVQSWYFASLLVNSMGIESAVYETITVWGVKRGGTVFY